MSVRDGLAALLDDLAGLPPRTQREILQALSPEERAALASHAGPTHEPAVATSPIVRGAFSPWLAARIDAVRDPESLDLAATRMTAATRQALLRSADTASGTPSTPGAAVPGKSLFDAFRGTLATCMGRS